MKPWVTSEDNKLIQAKSDYLKLFQKSVVIRAENNKFKKKYFRC